MRNWGEKSLLECCQGAATGSVLSARLHPFKGCYFAAAFSLRWVLRGCREKNDEQKEGKGFQQTQLQMAQNILMITGLLSSTVSCSHGYLATVPSLD